MNSKLSSIGVKYLCSCPSLSAQQQRMAFNGTNWFISWRKFIWFIPKPRDWARNLIFIMPRARCCRAKRFRTTIRNASIEICVNKSVEPFACIDYCVDGIIAWNLSHVYVNIGFTEQRKLLKINKTYRFIFVYFDFWFNYKLLFIPNWIVQLPRLKYVQFVCIRTSVVAVYFIVVFVVVVRFLFKKLNKIRLNTVFTPNVLN